MVSENVISSIIYMDKKEKKFCMCHILWEAQGREILASSFPANINKQKMEMSKAGKDRNMASETVAQKYVKL